MDLGLRVLGILLGLSASDCKHGPKLYACMCIYIYIYIYSWLVVCMYTGTQTHRGGQSNTRIGLGEGLFWGGISARKTCQAFLRNLRTAIFKKPMF